MRHAPAVAASPCPAPDQKDVFVAKLAHELRQPIGAILTAVNVMREHGDAADRARDVIERQARLLRRLVDDLLDVTRVAQGKVDLQKERFDAREVVQEVASAMVSVFHARRQRFSLMFPADGVWLDADRTRLEQVVTNLLSNAAKYTAEGGAIALNMECTGGMATIRVTDNGKGIAPDALPHVFELFMQESALHGGGLGIGLNVVRGLVELHGGSVDARSDGVGQGSEFIVTLPASAAPAHT